MFTLFSGGHIGVARRYTRRIRRFHIGLCKFLRNISTNNWRLGKRTVLKLGQMSYFFIFYNITILQLSGLDNFWFTSVFYCVTVKTIYWDVKPDFPALLIWNIFPCSNICSFAHSFQLTVFQSPGKELPAFWVPKDATKFPWRHQSTNRRKLLSGKKPSG